MVLHYFQPWRTSIFFSLPDLRSFKQNGPPGWARLLSPPSCCFVLKRIKINKEQEESRHNATVATLNNWAPKSFTPVLFSRGIVVCPQTLLRIVSCDHELLLNCYIRRVSVFGVGGGGGGSLTQHLLSPRLQTDLRKEARGAIAGSWRVHHFLVLVTAFPAWRSSPRLTCPQH